jgi:regulator of RNase E activity RraB
MRLFDFLKPKSSRQFVSEKCFKSNLDRQIQMIPQILDQLRQLNVSATQELKLEFFFYTNTEDKARQLANEIAKLNYSVQYGISGGDRKLIVVNGWTTKKRMTNEVIENWTKQMCELGYMFDCDFDGWGTNPNESEIIQSTIENDFVALRDMAFTVTADQLNLSLSTDETAVYGVIMDWEMDGTTATVISFYTGDASLYLSSGGGVIGGGQHKNVSIAAKQFVQIAQLFLDKASPDQMRNIPVADQVKFHLLTNNGIYVVQDEVKNFENKSSKCLRLFEESNKVLTELRMITENK